MDIVKALSFPFQDKDWIVKILIGGLWIIPIVNFFVFGYLLKVMKKTALEGAYELAAWEDWGSLFAQGFYVFLIYLIYSLIPAILYFIGFALMFGSLPGLGILFVILGALGFIAMALFLPMVLATYAATGEFGSAFKFGEILGRIGKSIGNYVIAIIVPLGLGIVCGILNLIPLLGAIINIFAIFYVWNVAVVLYGTAYYSAGSPVPPAAPAL